MQESTSDVTGWAVGKLLQALFFSFFFGLLVVVAAPYGDRRTGIPERGAPPERLLVRLTQWLSAFAWGVGVIPLAFSFFALSSVVLAPTIPVLFACGLYVLARRYCAAQHVYLSARAFFPALYRHLGNYGAQRASTFITTALAVTLGLAAWWTPLSWDWFWAATAATWLNLVQVSIKVGHLAGREAAAHELHVGRLIPDIASILGVPVSVVDGVQCDFIYNSDGSLTVSPLPPAARLHVADRNGLEARVAAVRPDLMVTAASSERLVLSLADEATIARRQSAVASGGLIGERTSTTTSADDNNDMIIDLRGGFEEGDHSEGSTPNWL